MKYTQYISLALLGLALVVSYIDCKPQITFSTDWYGGKRSAPSTFESSKIDLDKKTPGWGKRTPGWGKRFPAQHAADSLQEQDVSSLLDGDVSARIETLKAMRNREENIANMLKAMIDVLEMLEKNHSKEPTN